MPLLGALLAAQSVAIARKHALCAGASSALWKSLGRVPTSKGESADCAVPSEHPDMSLLEWNEALLSRCPARTSCGGSDGGMHGALACSGQENFEPVATDQGAAEPTGSAAVGKGKQRAPRGKARKGVPSAFCCLRTAGCCANSLLLLLERFRMGMFATKLPLVLLLCRSLSPLCTQS